MEAVQSVIQKEIGINPDLVHKEPYFVDFMQDPPEVPEEGFSGFSFDIPLEAPKVYELANVKKYGNPFIINDCKIIYRNMISLL